MSNDELSLYDRMGGETGIASMVDSFYGKVLKDPILEPYFRDVPMERLLNMQREFFGAAMGGPTVYSGCPVAHVHSKMGIVTSELQQFTEHLIETLQENGMAEEDIYDLISNINLYADDITNRSNIDG